MLIVPRADFASTLPTEESNVSNDHGRSPLVTRRFLLGTAAVGALAAAAPAAPASAAPPSPSPAPGSPGRRRPVPTTVATEVMREVYEEVKTPYPYGPVVTAPPGADLVDSPSVFRYRRRWYMVHLVFRNNGYETLLASSPDLLNWKLEGTILPFRPGAWDARQAAGYIALQDPEWGGSAELGIHDGRYWMTYLGGPDAGYEGGPLSIGVASTTTPDKPIPWKRLDAPVLAPSDPDTRYWERSKLFKSTVIRDPHASLGAQFVMYYNATGAGGFGNETIGMALSDDMVRWRRYREAPVVLPYEWHGAAVAGDPQVVRIGDLWVMFFWNTIDTAPNGRFDSFACSYDLVNWTRWEGQKLTGPVKPYEYNQSAKPWVIKHNGVVYHYHDAQGTDGQVTIALATSVDLRGESTGPVRVSASHTFAFDSPQALVDGSTANEPRWTAFNSPNTDDWVQLDFDSARRCSGLTVHVYSDGGGVQPPREMRVEYLRGRGFEQVQAARWNPSGPQAGPNTVTFDGVATRAIRVHFVHREGGYQKPGIGIYSGATEIDITK